MSRNLVLITYNVKPGVSLEEYAEYTRSVDYPVFRQNPGVVDYSNYVVRDFARGEEWFKHFDLMYVDDLDAFYADGKLHFGDERILEHAARWRDTWGVGPDATTGAKVNITLAEQI
ncbi:hypothetical protein [uncultured Aeromicrobium sp.]|uniref:hypothetical protein n=1 Tax=uncultured Aeromicrobium sp. TaxID=337820 RepID=UPI0025E12A09|nr:hypothetical protein [uncultured Aeromicrobium sp.]